MSSNRPRHGSANLYLAAATQPLAYSKQQAHTTHVMPTYSICLQSMCECLGAHGQMASCASIFQIIQLKYDSSVDAKKILNHFLHLILTVWNLTNK